MELLDEYLQESLKCILSKQFGIFTSNFGHTPKDQRHLQVFSENVAAILQDQSACLSHWLPYLSHRQCEARSHMERLSYLGSSWRSCHLPPLNHCKLCS
jgi:hypothetical protein